LQAVLTDAQVEQHNRLYGEAWRTASPHLRIDGRHFFWPAFLVRARLRRAKGLFEQALAINPNGWQSMWALGKLHQRLSEHASAVSWLQKAATVAPQEPNVQRELGIELLEVGEFERAVAAFRVAGQAQPSDPGHRANLALSLLLHGSTTEALGAADTALAMNPADPISQRLHSLVASVAEGRRPAPRTVREAASAT
jgi:Flp pilus assembly protein TadD